MTRSLGRSVPDEIRSRLDGADPASHEGFTPLLITQDAHGWPHVAMLSAGEVLVIGDEVRIALWPSSTATDDLRRTERGLLYAVVGDDAVGLRLSCRATAALNATGMNLVAFVCSVDEAFSDKVGYAEITTGIGFRLRDPERDLPRWERTVRALRDLPG